MQNPDSPSSTAATETPKARLPALLLPFLAAMLLLNAHALRREAELLPFDAPVRAPALKALAPLCRATTFLFLDVPRNLSEALEKRTINE